jgi:hypothetical protein
MRCVRATQNAVEPQAMWEKSWETFLRGGCAIARNALESFGVP